MSDLLHLDRRSFLKLSGTAAGGLLLTLYVRPAAAEGSVAPPFVPGAFIRIDPDGAVTLWSKNPDMGQGVKTSLPMILAEELGAEWSRVRVEQADLNPEAYGGQGSGGSDSIRSEWMAHREAGAIARQVLVLAASRKWTAKESDCYTMNNAVLHRLSARKIYFGDLVADAARIPIGDMKPVLKDPEDFTILGSRVKGVDNRRIILGEPIYGIDARVPNMLFAVLAKCPVFGGKPVSFDPAESLKVPGVKKILQIDGLENPTHLQPCVAVVATSTWAAMKGREALKVTWDEGVHSGESSEQLGKWFVETAGKGGKILRESGNVEQALAEAGFKVEADYEGPFLPHATMEPQNCLAHVHDGECEIWGPMQMPMSARRVVSAATGIAPEKIKIHITRLGGGFGRRLMSDYVAEAAVVSMKAGAPVQVVWSREDDMTHDYYRTASFHRIRAGVDAEGKISVWTHHLLSVSRNAYRLDSRPAEATETYGMLAPRSADAKAEYVMGMQPVLVPNVRLQYSQAMVGVPVGAWRAPSHNFTAFAVESAIDELAHASGQDAVQLRLRMLGSSKDFPFTGDDVTPYDPDRLKHVLQMVAEKGEWGKKPAEGVGRGIACHYTFGAYAAICMDVSVDPKLKIHRIHIALDCGTPVHTAGLEAQAQGGVIDGLGSALFGEITVRGGQAVQSNFDGYRLIRNEEIPPVDVYIVRSTKAPTGFGEMALPPVAPALANAIFAASGKRIRKLPFAANGIRL